MQDIGRPAADQWAGVHFKFPFFGFRASFGFRYSDFGFAAPQRYDFLTGTRHSLSSASRKITHNADTDSCQLILDKPKRRSSNTIGVSSNEHPTARQR